jgi:hypothetical protein
MIRKRIEEITKKGKEIEKNLDIQPSYIGKNASCKFNGTTAHFNLDGSPGEALSPELMKEYRQAISGSFDSWNLARATKYGNTNKTKTETTHEFWEDFEAKAKEMGVAFINYIPVQEDYIFHGMKIYGKNTVILGYEMRWDRIKTANSNLAAFESMRTQDELGKITVKMTEYLQKQGYKAEANVPFGGKLLVPPHMVAATLAIRGQNGLSITPEFGPRQRWGIITTDADIPPTKKRDLSKLREFCDNCGLCRENCLGEAIFEKPIDKGGGVLTHMDFKICTETMRTTMGCSVCLSVCPIGHIPKPKKLKKILKSIERI